MLTDDTAGCHCHERGKFYKSIVDTAMFPIKTVWGCHCSLAHKIGASFETLTNFVSQETIKREAWNKHCQNKRGTKMGEKECRSFRNRNRSC